MTTATATAPRTRKSNDIAEVLINALSIAWRTIRRNHSEVPEIVITMASGTLGRGGLVYGHFAPGRWQHGETTMHELFVSGEGLERGGRATLGTLLHEAAHSIAAARNVQDVSRGGRYHNSNFREIAEEVGICVERSEQLGWSTTTVPDETADRYAKLIDRLDKAITAYRYGEFSITLPPGGTGRTGGGFGGRGRGGSGGSTNLKLTCLCSTPRVIRASRKVYDGDAIMCNSCECSFEPR